VDEVPPKNAQEHALGREPVTVDSVAPMSGWSRLNPVAHVIRSQAVALEL